MGSNIWAKFKRMMPDSPLTVATVIAHNSDDTSTVSTAGGGDMRVLGKTVSIGSKAYVKDGAIVSEAPDLVHYEIQV